MKLLLMFPSQIRGGAEGYVFTIASAAVQQGWDVHAAFPHTPGTTSLIHDFTQQHISYHPLNIQECDEYWRETRTRYLWRLLRTLRLLFSVKPERVLLSLPWMPQGLSSIVACGLCQVPTMVVFHSAPQPFQFGHKRLHAYHWAKNRQQQWVAVSEYVRHILCETFQLGQADFLRIYNGLPLVECSDSLQSRRPTTRIEVRNELGLAESSYLILTVGRLHPDKGYQIIIPTLPHLIKEFPTIRFIWAGEGDYRTHLEQMLREYQVEDYVSLLGYRTDVPRLLQAADLFLFPTYFEGLPFALLEAMSFKTPILASKVASIPEIIEHGTHGVLFRAGDSCEILESLRWALRHPERMQDMAQQAAIRVNDFRQEAMISQTLAVLRDISKIPKTR
jgi:glycosyltransferase involved in cell wall biosynthesis